MEYARKLLEEIGLEGERLQMVNLSSSMAGNFVEAVNEMNAHVLNLGRSPLKNMKNQAELEEPFGGS